MNSEPCAKLTIRVTPKMMDRPAATRNSDDALASPVTVEGRDDCTVDVIPANLDAAYSLVDELLYGRPASDVGPDEDFPEVGRSFADTVVVTCAGLL